MDYNIAKEYLANVFSWGSGHGTPAARSFTNNLMKAVISGLQGKTGESSTALKYAIDGKNYNPQHFWPYMDALIAIAKQIIANKKFPATISRPAGELVPALNQTKTFQTPKALLPIQIQPVPAPIPRSIPQPIPAPPPVVIPQPVTVAQPTPNPVVTTQAPIQTLAPAAATQAAATQAAATQAATSAPSQTSSSSAKTSFSYQSSSQPEDDSVLVPTKLGLGLLALIGVGAGVYYYKKKKKSQSNFRFRF